MATILIRKADGTTEPFDVSKLRNSLRRSGANSELTTKVVRRIESELKEGVTTQEIYTNAFEVLREYEHEHPATAARYSIKRAILELGPSGFPFEQFVAGVMKAHGATGVETGLAMQGACVPHEVDVVGMAHGKRFGMEVKFHNSLGTKTDLKVVLYVKARWDDLLAAKGRDHIDQGWLVTNTRFTRNVIRYVQCSGAMQLLGWDYPHGRGLEVLVEEAHLHPITMLTTLTNREKRNLLDADKVLCRDVHGDADALRQAGIEKSKVQSVLAQITALCQG